MFLWCLQQGCIDVLKLQHLHFPFTTFEFVVRKISWIAEDPGTKYHFLQCQLTTQFGYFGTSRATVYLVELGENWS